MAEKEILYSLNQNVNMIFYFIKCNYYTHLWKVRYFKQKCFKLLNYIDLILYLLLFQDDEHKNTTMLGKPFI